MRTTLTNDTVHTIEEFKNFPFDKDYDEKTMSWGRGGHGFPDWQRTISFYTEEMGWVSAEVWPIPPIIAKIIDLDGDCEIRRLQGKIRDLLGIE